MKNLDYRSIKIALVIIVILSLLLFLILFFSKKSGREFSFPVLGSTLFNFKPLFTQKPESTGSAKLVSAVVDVTDDVRALGYTGQKKIAVDSKGNMYLGYRKKVGGKHEIFVAKVSESKNKFTVENTKSPIVRIGNTSQRVPSLVADQKDAVHVVWYGEDPKGVEGNRQIKYVNSANGGKSWSAWKNISVVDGFKKGEDYWQEHPDIAVFGSDVYVVWEGKDESNKEQQVKFSHSADGGKTWSSWKNILPTKENTQSRPTVSVDKSGGLYVLMYSSQSADTQQIWYSYSDSKGDRWTPWANVSKSNLDSRHAFLLTKSGGGLFAVWRSEVSKGSSGLFYSQFEKGVWAEPRSIKASANLFFPSATEDAEGNIYVSAIEDVQSWDLPRENPTSGSVALFMLSKNSTDFVEPGITIKNSLYPYIVYSGSKSLMLLSTGINKDSYNLVLTKLTI